MNSTPSRPGRKLAALILATFLCLFIAGCAQLPEAAPPENPAVLAAVPGTDLQRITLTEHAVERLGLKTEAIGTDPQSQKLTVAYFAILYDAAGKTWVYTNPEPLVYVRQSITVERINGDVALLADGPPPGTIVVTTGAEELLGTEFDTGE